MEKGLIPISQMAAIHGISRQTLILYDKKGLFHPKYVSDTGYRYYSVYQIPYLREICFLKNLGMSLDKISEHMHHRNTDSICQELAGLDRELELKIAALQEKRTYIQQRLQIYEKLDVQQKNLNHPYIQWFPERKFTFAPFDEGEMDKAQLHLTLMRAWNTLKEEQMMPSKGFGALLRYSSILDGKPLYQAGSIIQIPFPEQMPQEKLLTIPAGEYASMYKFGMPYDMEPLEYLLDWIRDNGYEVAGDIIDLCLLDTTFYDERHSVDFCRLEIPIKSMEKCDIDTRNPL